MINSCERIKKRKSFHDEETMELDSETYTIRLGEYNGSSSVVLDVAQFLESCETNDEIPQKRKWQFFTMFITFWMKLMTILSTVLGSPRPLTAIDLGIDSITTFTRIVSFNRVGSPTLSPDLLRSIFTVEGYNVTTNVKQTSIKILNHTDNSLIDVAVGGSPFWLSNDIVAFTSENQLLYANLKIPNKVNKLTNFNSAFAGNIKADVKSSTLIFSAKVPLNNEKSIDFDPFKSIPIVEKFDSAKTYDQLFVRHWDHFVDQGSRTQLFAVKYSIDGEKSEVKLVGKARNLLQGTKMEAPIAPFGDEGSFGFSPDGQMLCFNSRVENVSMSWNTNLDIFLVPIDGSNPPVSISTENKGADVDPVFSPDGKYLAWLRMETAGYESDKNVISLYNLETKITKILLRTWDRSPETITWSPDSQKIFVKAQDLGHFKIFEFTIDSLLTNGDEDVIKVRPVIDNGNNGKIAFGVSSPTDDYHTLFFLRSTATTTPDIFSINHQDLKLTQRTFLNKKLLEETMTSVPEEFWFKGANNEDVMGWMFKPHGFKEGVKYPVAFLIHGGPEGAWNSEFSFRWNPQVYAGAGYVVVCVNFHGSTGYGAEFTRSILKNWGGWPFEDLMKGMDYIEKLPFVDSKRICALGASYGGYMANWINGHSDRFSAIVNHDGLFSPASSYYSTEELFFKESEFGGPQFSNPEFYKKWDPSAFVKNWKTPTLVIHGELDYRLTVTEGLSTFTALQRRGIPSRFLYFPDENHWVMKQANAIRWYSEIFKWIGKWTSETPDKEVIEWNEKRQNSKTENIVNTKQKNPLVFQ